MRELVGPLNYKPVPTPLVCVCVCACVRVCVRACVRACVCVCDYVCSLYHNTSDSSIVVKGARTYCIINEWHQAAAKECCDSIKPRAAKLDEMQDIVGRAFTS